MIDCRLIDTPISLNVSFAWSGEPLTDPRRYRRFVGNLNYPIVSHLIIASRFLDSPCDSQNAVLHVLQY